MRSGTRTRRSGQVPVDTKSPRSLIASLNRGVATLKHGLPLVLFPEGGRAATGQLQTMMSGCAYMAIKAQVPLIPLTLIGTYELLPIHVYALHPRPLLIVIGDPNLSNTSGRPMRTFFIVSSIVTRSPTSCIRSLSDETITTSPPASRTLQA